MKHFGVIIFLLFATKSNGQCPIPNNLNTTNVNYYNAEVNWIAANSVHHYRIRYKEINDTNWSSINNVGSTLNTKLLSNLYPLSHYIWKIRSYCDTTNTSVSNWSIVDTFFTSTTNCPNTSNLFTTNLENIPLKNKKKPKIDIAIIISVIFIPETPSFQTSKNKSLNLLNTFIT